MKENVLIIQKTSNQVGKEGLVKQNPAEQRKLYISGMTCINCEQALSRALSELEGIDPESLSISYKSSEIGFALDEKLTSEEELFTTIEETGYQASFEPFSEALLPRLLRVSTILGAILLGFFLLDYFGLLNYLAPNTLADSSTGLLALFVVGLITSVHCIAMCGGINLSVSIPKNASDIEKPIASLRAPFAYNLGRVVSYTLIGAILGGLGSLAGLSFSPESSTFLQGLIKIVAGVFMLIMGLSMLNLFPEIRKLVPRIPNWLRELAPQNSRQTPFVVGLLNGLMPCGPLQSIQILAFASGSVLLGAASMLLFSLGTVPLMLGFGSLVSSLGQRFARFVTLFGAGLVAVLGLAMLAQGGALSGLFDSNSLLIMCFSFALAGIILSLSDESNALAGVVAVMLVAVAFVGLYLHGPFVPNAADPNVNYARTEGAVQVVESDLAPGSYPIISVKAGTPVRWNIKAAPGTINGCNNRMIIKDLGIEYRFKEGDNIIEFTPTKSGAIQYSCWMGMIYGQIEVK